MRNEKIDLLRFIGLSMIILAHSGPPELLFQLRNFDVPLMVIVSGMSFGLSFRQEPYLIYLWKRVKRLLFPLWIFLSAYFLIDWLFEFPLVIINLKTVLNSYLLAGGIGYVWIIRVFLLVALVAPFLSLLNNRIRSHRKYIFTILGASVVYEAIRFLSLPYIDEGLLKAISFVVLYICPYSIVFALGLRIPDLKLKTNYQLSLIFLIIFLVDSIYIFFTKGGFVATQEYKYPPSIYYLSYAIFISLLLWCVSEPLWRLVSDKYIKSFILFVAQNSFWVYLWHIPVVETIRVIEASEAIENQHYNFTIKWLLVLGIATLTTYFQTTFVKEIVIPKVRNNSLKKNLKILFTG